MKYKIFLYADRTDEKFSPTKIKKYLEEKVRFSVKIRESFLEHHKKNYKIDWLSYKLSEIRIKNTEVPYKENIPHKLEVSYEEKLISQKVIPSGIIYDGFRMQEIFSNLLFPSENKLNFIHIVISNRLVSTFEDGRHHLRTIILGIPSIISLSGIIEAPAKPKEYYILRRNLRDEFFLIDFKKKYKQEFIDYGDKRIGDAIISYCLQAIFYQITAQAFCKSKNCCLYNAHYQKEVIKILVGNKGKLCKRHQKILEQF